MEVTEIETIPIAHTLPEGKGLGDARGFGHDRSTTLVRLETDTGLSGWGEAFGPGSIISATIDELFAEDIVGMDPFEVESLAEESYTDPYHFGGDVFVQSAVSAMADALMVMHPDHTYVHESGLAEYYHRICDATDLGVVVYKRGPEITSDVLHELTEREEVVAVKYAVDDVKEFSQTVDDAPGNVTWVNGIAERYALSFAIEGAEGYTTGVGNFLPERTLALFEAVRAGQWERARTLQRMLRPFEDLREETGADNTLTAANNVPVVKYGMDLAGYDGGPVRAPLVNLSDADRNRVEAYYARLDELEAGR